MTEATLKVTAAPENVQVAVVGFESSYQAVETVVEFVQKGLPIAAMELLDETVRIIGGGLLTSRALSR